MTASAFSIAGFAFEIIHPVDIDLCCLVRSLAPFILNEKIKSPLFTINILPSPLFARDIIYSEVIGTSDNGFGKMTLSASAEGGYCISLSFDGSGRKHFLTVSAGFDKGDCHLDLSDPLAGQAFSSLLHAMFVQAILPHGGISFHASCVMSADSGYMFLGESGTGKSTHSRLWLQTFEGFSLLNDDNPVVVVGDGEARVWGTPWSGKTPCYRNESRPLKGIIRLSQAKRNEYREAADTEAFITLLPSCSAIHSDRRLAEALYSNLALLSSLVKIGNLECLPDSQAAIICRTAQI